MIQRIKISENTYIEYEIDEEKEIIASTLHIVNNGLVISEFENDYYKGILACLIGNRLRNVTSSSEEIYGYAWPIAQKTSENFEKHVSDRIAKMRNIFKKLVGVDATRKLFPYKRRNDDYKICFSSDCIESEYSVPPENDSLVYFHDLFGLRRLGFKDDAIASQIVENDEIIYGVTENSPEEGSREKWLQAFKEEPEAWGFLINNSNKIVGNYSMVILSPKQKEELLSGNLYEGLLSLKDTYTFSEGNGYCLYILNISVNYEYNTKENRDLLYGKMFSFILEQAKKGVFFSSIYTTTSVYIKETKSYGFQEILKRDDKFIVLGIENFPQNLRWNRRQELLDAYKKCNL